MNIVVYESYCPICNEERKFGFDSLLAAKRISFRWRSTSFTPQSVPFAPKMNFGRRGSTYVKGVYFGNPGMPRCSYPSTRMDPGLGPSLGLAKYRPQPKAEKFDITSGNHLHSTPASFILEGVVGFNPNTAREIRELRRQLASVEELYEESMSKLQDAIDLSQKALQQHKSSLKEADLRREDLSKILAARRRQLAGLHPIVDEERAQITEERKKLLRLTMGEARV